MGLSRLLSCNKILDFYALFGEHFFMLCFNIIGNIACVQITGEIQNLISALLKVFKTFVK